MQSATFGGGCFWCLEAFFKRLKGVETVVPGYSGGHSFNPTYEEVCDGKSGHAEVVQITFNASVISFEKLVEVFLACHDPTSLNRQGNDVGEQYRSIILFHNEEQAEVARTVIKSMSINESKAIVTQITPLITFYAAENYHYNYFEKNPKNFYCSTVVSDKLKKLVETFQELLK